ncbi:MAG TPA: DUF169 domain-containing protein [Candidatus Dormibacteraeota bacterium]|nr:DUF169 domain-containing protein [Candidatus Dormibacteraeota bacterium]
MNHRELADSLISVLGLDRPPVALSFTDARPADVEVPEAAVPSACTFWRRAEHGVFYAPADRHFNCAVGAMTMGFELPAEVEQTLMGLASQMTDLCYIEGDEAARLPSTGRRSAGILYGPLAEFPIAPDAILLWLNARQAMLFNEAAGSVQWTGAVPTPLLGRPSCAALPVALATAGVTLSLGCAGMRTYTAVADDRILAVCPGGLLPELGARLARAAQANVAMDGFYASRLAEFAG